MRAGPLSDDRIIKLLNESFVPVFTSNEDYFGPNPRVPAEEIAALRQVHEQGYAAKKSVGTVHVYLLRPNENLWETSHVAEAAANEKLLTLLRKAVAELKPKQGGALIPPRNVSQPKVPSPGGRAIHVTARRESRGSWGEFPSENWPVLDEKEWTALSQIPADKKPGDSWEIQRATAHKLLSHFHPQTEDCDDTERNRVDHLELRAILIKPDLAKLEGRLVMKRTFYPNKEDDRFVRADLEGYIKGNNFRLVSKEGTTYGQEKFHAAATSQGY